MKIISIYNKRPLKWSKSNNAKGEAEWYRTPVNLPKGAKMAMCLVQDKEGRTVTRHMLIDSQ